MLVMDRSVLESQVCMCRRQVVCCPLSANLEHASVKSTHERPRCILRPHQGAGFALLRAFACLFGAEACSIVLRVTVNAKQQGGSRSFV